MVQFESTLLERFKARLNLWNAYWQARLFPKAAPTRKLAQISWSTLGLRVGMQVESDLIVNPRDQP